MKRIIVSGIAVAALLLNTSCKYDFDNDVTSTSPTAGQADFTKYVALGNSLTSGYRDGALYIDGQNESYPNIIAGQLKLVGGGVFKQPLMSDNLGGIPSLGINNKLVLSASTFPSPAPASGTGTTTLANIYTQGPYNNMGVPGAKSFHLVTPGYGSAANLSLGKANPYFVRFSSSATTTIAGDAAAQKPTFFSLWIGNNDVLSYATSGGVGVDQKANTNAATYGSNDISSPAVVAGAIKGVLDAMKSVGATKGVIGNIPSVTSIPFFTTVPAMPISGLTDAQVTQLNTAYATYNGGLAKMKSMGAITDAEYQKRLINFKAGAVANGAVIVDKDLRDLSKFGLPSYRQTTAKDLILLTTSGVLKTGGGTATALTDAQVLTETEADKVETAVVAFNTQITSLASAYGLALADMNAKMKELNAASGLYFDGVKYTAGFVTGGAFSLDGVHPTGRGAAILANEFIKAINSKYSSTIPQVNVNSYTGVALP